MLSVVFIAETLNMEQMRLLAQTPAHRKAELVVNVRLTRSTFPRALELNSLVANTLPGLKHMSTRRRAMCKFIIMAIVPIALFREN